MNKKKFEDGSGYPGVCPICGSECLAYGTEIQDPIGSRRPWRCEDCKAEGEETYETTFTGHYNKY